MALSAFEELAAASRTLKSARALHGGKVGIQNKGVIEKAVTTTNAQYAHGTQGVFNTPGVDPNVISTLMRPRGMSAALPLVASVLDTPFFEIITNQNASTGSEPTNECNTPIAVGSLLKAILSAPFGRVIRKTQDIAANRPGLLTNRADPMDLRVVNNMDDMSPWVPDPARNQLVLQSELGKQYFALGLEFERQLERMLFTGNGSITGTRPDHGYAQFYGFDTLINTGKQDATNGMPIPAADALIVPWNSALASGTTPLNGQNADIVTTIGAMLNFLYSRADKLNLLPVDWVIAMRYDLFFELTRLWPCSYLTNACTTAVLNGGTQFVAGNDQVAMRDDMRTGKFLWINGMRVPVLVTDGINETTGSGVARSDIYFIPRSAAGMVTTYIQYFDYSNPMIQQELNSLVGSQFTVTNGGMYMWTFDRSLYCYNLVAKVDPRLISRMPFLSARLTNVGYNTPIHTLDGFPGAVYGTPAGGSTVGTGVGYLYAGGI